MEEMQVEFETGVTSRGFEYLIFSDQHDKECCMQRSSLADEDAIWLGNCDPEPKILASKVIKGGTGWIPYEIPEDVSIRHRMLLTRDHAVTLALKLLQFGLFNKIDGEDVTDEDIGKLLSEILATKHGKSERCSDD